MITEVIGVFIPIVLGLAGIIMVIIMRKYESKERLAMIEKGLDPNIRRRRHYGGGYNVFKFAFLAIGVGIGLLFGSLLDNYTTLHEDVSYFSMIAIFGGIGLFVAHYVVKKQEEKQEEE